MQLLIIFSYYFTFVVLTILKKNYTRLCHCLPKDYKKTVNIIREVQRLPDDALNYVTNLPSVDLINEAIIVTLIIGINADVGSLQFCDIMETLADSEHSKTAIRALRNGNLHIENQLYPRTSMVSLLLLHKTKVQPRWSVNNKNTIWMNGI